MTKFETIDEILFAIAVLAIEEDGLYNSFGEIGECINESHKKCTLWKEKKKELSEAIKVLKSKISLERLKVEYLAEQSF